jgi:hypothetical protein
MERPMNQFQYISRSPQTVPGLKVAYGSAASPFSYAASDEEPLARKGFFARLKDAVFNLVTEEAENDRPIGISQISRRTFQASETVSGQTIVRSDRGTQDYRFSQLVEPQR